MHRPVGAALSEAEAAAYAEQIEAGAKAKEGRPSGGDGGDGGLLLPTAGGLVTPTEGSLANPMAVTDDHTGVVDGIAIAQPQALRPQAVTVKANPVHPAPRRMDEDDDI